jgi:hypothetical protein
MYGHKNKKLGAALDESPIRVVFGYFKSLLLLTEVVVI